MKADFFYLETDGQVFLIRDRGRYRFPRRRQELPCRCQPVGIIPVGRKRILFARALMRCHPRDWFHKDSLIGRSEVDPLVRVAVNRTLPRGAAKVALIEKGRVLMVKASRGLTKDIWNLPGGFIGYGEHPARTAVREVREELGIRIQLGRLLGVYADVFPHTGGYMLSFVYLGRRISTAVRADPDEIAAWRWMPVRRAIRATPNPFARAGLRDYLKTART